MSHFTEIKTQIKDIEALRLAVVGGGVKVVGKWRFENPEAFDAVKVRFPGSVSGETYGLG